MNQNISGFNRELVIRAYFFNLNYAKDLVDDLSDEQIYKSPGPGLENNPGFTLGHLVIASAMVADSLGKNYDVPLGWDEFFGRTGPGDPRLPISKSADLPSINTLVKELERQHGIVEDGIRQFDAKHFEQPVEWRFNRYFPTVGDMVAFMCITHEAMHLSQAAAWRRAYGFESSLARL
jgi:hypothetical protein